MASGSKTGQYAYNPDLNALRKQVLDACSNVNAGGQCKVVYEECMP